MERPVQPIKQLHNDVIGVLDEIGYTQPTKGSRKVQVNFKLRDLIDNRICCILWEDYAIKFITYTREKTDVGATIIAMKYAKIKPED
ncbi:replication protein A 70 kDa DNA-binding subunit C [Trifolium repens]|nr:replication protein A 70 kDa DNA-binding subunit C [Trifolium repens]